MHRRLAELDRLDRRHGLGAMPRPVAARRSRRSHGAVLPSLLVTVVVLAGTLLLTPGISGYRVRALIGIGNDRIAQVVDARGDRGHFRFSLMQLASDEPVSFNPCREIQYVVNPEGAPAGYRELISQSVAEINAATGFRFSYVGTTDDRSFTAGRDVSLKSAPVLIGWATPDEVPGLAGEVAGLGGSLAAERRPGRLTYVTGTVALDRDSFADLGSQPGGIELQRAIVMHELGHVVGLAHVQDPHELMNVDNVGLTSFGPGDLQGLARLGAVDCL